jgi:HAE1 family hydrophobic/amphiphilic exporter-1
LHLRDVAAVSDAAEEETSAALNNGQRMLAVDIVKVQGANTIAAADAARTEMADLQKVLPPDVKLTVIRDSSTGIRNSVTNVQHTVLEGGVLTIVIVFLFLASWRSTVITGLTLPIAGARHLRGPARRRLHVERDEPDGALAFHRASHRRRHCGARKHHAPRRHGQGSPPRRAGRHRRDRARRPRHHALHRCRVFLPVAFMGGIIGRFFLQFGLTIAVAVLISLFVSFTLDPMLSSIWFDPDAHGRRSGPIGGLLAHSIA